MRIDLLVPDVPRTTGAVVPSDAGAFSHVLDALGAALDGASRAENAFAAGSGSLQQAVYERARADVALTVATAALQRAVQSVQSVLNMQV